jgi:hypothetical protein
MLPGVSVGNCQRVLVDDSGIMRTQMMTHGRLEMVPVYGTPCAVPAQNINRVNYSEMNGLYLYHRWCSLLTPVPVQEQLHVPIQFGGHLGFIRSTLPHSAVLLSSEESICKG